MENMKRGRQEPKDSMWPLHAQWNSWPFGSNEHYAVACALGMGVTKQPKPVSRTRPFFAELRKAGLIDDNGNATVELKQEIEDKKTVHNFIQAALKEEEFMKDQTAACEGMEEQAKKAAEAEAADTEMAEASQQEAGPSGK